MCYERSGVKKDGTNKNGKGVNRNGKKKNPRVAELQSAWIIGFKRFNAQRPPKATGCRKSKCRKSEKKACIPSPE